MSETVDNIQKAAVSRLGQMVQQTIANVERQVVDTIGDFKALSQQSNDVLNLYVSNLNANFDELLDRESSKEEAVFNFDTLSLVQEEELEVMVALEGMVNAARNEHLPIFISFNARLSSLFPRKRIDESSNPLDPEQVATAFQEALRPLGLDAQNSLTVYRAFNNEVLKHLDDVLNEANQILIDSNVIPDLGMDGGSGRARQPSSARSAARTEGGQAFGTIEEEAYEDDEDRPELFSIMQNLLHSDITPETTTEENSQPGEAPPQVMVPTAMIPATAAPGDNAQASPAAAPAAMQPFQPQQGQTVEMVDQTKLMEILTNIQEKLSTTTPASVPGSLDDVDKLDISQSLGEILQSSSEDENVISAVDRQSSDIINLVTLLYEAIWDDNSVPIPIKELIGRTQITIIKVALADVEFFNNENHPARAILNEFASAGIGWTEVEELEKDPLYQKIQELVEKILIEYKDDIAFFDALIKDFRTFRAQEAAKTRQLEQRILKAKERNERMDDIRELVTQKVKERILGQNLDPFIEDLLNGPFHKFMVMLVLKEGPGSNAWKQAINTIDVLLWTVQSHEHEEDRDRLATVNPRLLNNLRKAFRITSIDKDEIDQLIEKLQLVQDLTFPEKPDEPEDEPETATVPDEPEETSIKFLAAGEFEEAEKQQEETAEETVAQASTEEAKAEAAETKEPPAESDEMADDDPHIKQVDSLAVGMWVEFAGEDENNTRCKLAAKINAIDKFIFVNRQGVKIVEKTKMGLAREIRDGTVSIVSDGLLFSRALESVIGNLRDTQHEQQTGSAYQPD
ncbi:MAG: DUF1631 domain-containing protein [Gammaproteobacteria bacterium]|nr:DUF1631 domain-containing protein [Gammaproteobacteria bacterium]MBT7371510.1 DUF1631 domain-containing protein [Gammaproteobacteria bacterium]